MRRILALVVIALIVVPPAAHAQDGTGRIIILEERLRMGPGASWEGCADAPAGRLVFRAWSPPGRTGEEARVLLFQDVDGYASPLLSAVATLDELMSAHHIEADTYCVRVTVSKTIEDTGDPRRPERPYKEVLFVLAHDPT